MLTVKAMYRSGIWWMSYPQRPEERAYEVRMKLQKKWYVGKEWKLLALGYACCTGGLLLG